MPPISGALLRIAAEQPIPTDVEQIAQHPQAVADHANLGPRIVRPADGPFRGPQPVAARAKAA